MPQVNLPSFYVPLEIGLDTVNTLSKLSGVDTGWFFKDTIGYRFPKRARSGYSGEIQSIREHVKGFQNHTIESKKAYPDCVIFVSDRTGRINVVFITNKQGLIDYKQVKDNLPAGSVFDMQKGGANIAAAIEASQDALKNSVKWLPNKSGMEKWLIKDSMDYASSTDYTVWEALYKKGKQ